MSSTDQTNLDFLLTQHGKYVFQGPGAEGFARRFLDRVDRTAKKHISFYTPQWAPERVVFAALGPSSGFRLQELLISGAADFTIHCTGAREAWWSPGDKPLGRRHVISFPHGPARTPKPPAQAPKLAEVWPQPSGVFPGLPVAAGAGGRANG